MFKTDYAEPGGKTVMGKIIYAGKGGHAYGAARSLDHIQAF